VKEIMVEYSHTNHPLTFYMPVELSIEELENIDIETTDFSGRTILSVIEEIWHNIYTTTPKEFVQQCMI